MSKSYKVLALIPARGGSKGIPHKNIIPVNGKPLIAYTIEAAKGCSFIDRVLVSTDDPRIQEVALEYGADAPFLRPAALSQDDTKSIDVVLHAIDYCKNEEGDPYDIVVLLQPTSPLRDSNDISGALSLFAKTGCDSLCSVTPLREHPLLSRSMNEETGLLFPLLKHQSTVRRQDMPPYYHVDGAIYINYCNDLREDTSLNDNDCGYPLERSHSVDVDDMDDLNYAEFLLKRREELYE